MLTIYRVLLVAHVLGGTLGLGSLAVPLIAKKGGALHKRAGWVFTLGMALVSLTGLCMAASWITFPALTQPALSAHEAQLNGSFLALIGVLTGNALVQSISAITREQHPGPRPRMLELSSLSLLGVLAAASLVVGVRERHTLSVVFGAGSLLLAAQDLAFVLRPLPSKMAWWYQHMTGMSTACTSAVTAFLVLGLRRLVDVSVFGGAAWLLWVLPAAVIPPLFQLWIVWYKRRFEAASRTRAAALAESVRS